MGSQLDYNLFFRFFETYKEQQFKDIEPRDPFISMLEEKLEGTGQFFHLADLIKLKILYCSHGCHKFFGIREGQVDPSVYLTQTHPSDIRRHATGRGKLFKNASDMLIEQQDKWVISTNFKTINASGNTVELLYQVCIFYAENPYRSVFSLQVNTDVTDILQIPYGYHYYTGNDLSFFRYPDSKMLRVGNIFSRREFDILKCIASGMDSQEIAKNLFLSVHTVNTHRRNILDKTGNRSTHELVIELQERGVL